MLKTPYDFTGKKVDCEKHGLKMPTVEYSVDGEVKIRVCFLCWSEKQCEGLKNYAGLPTNPKE